jgi:colicin import membrane protein
MLEPVLPSPPTFFRPEPRFSNLLLLSVGLHVGLAILFSGRLMPRTEVERPPVYYVDLSQLPVANPQAGRPDGGGVRQSKPTPPKPPAPQPQPESAPTKTAAPTPKPQPTVARTAPAKTKETPVPAKGDAAADQKHLQQTLDRMRREQERAAVAERIAGLTGTGRSDAPLGMPDGTGNQTGVSQALWLQELLKSNWSLGRYQVLRRDLEAQVRVSYDAQGRLIDYRFLEESGDAAFDESVRRAILKSRELPFQPGQRLDIPVIFNLKDLME